MLTYLLNLAGIIVIVAGLVAAAFNRLSDYQVYGLLAVSQVLVGASGFLTGNTVAASISAAAAGFFAWKWWNGGGGDGTRRRLRSWARRFRGVRRTAPAGAS
ncbi:hypothetical protein AB0L71_28250 [Streptomyces sp. NPDC052052]|uniref:hypothetical protein n=1 Tax=Streptomyces sp. NPDC052052 TaxID=3154756 RepID=UPI003445B255